MKYRKLKEKYEGIMENQQMKIAELEEEINSLKSSGKNFRFQNNYTQCYESNLFCIKLIAKIDEVIEVLFFNS